MKVRKGNKQTKLKIETKVWRKRTKRKGISKTETNHLKVLWDTVVLEHAFDLWPDISPIFFHFLYILFQSLC